MYQNLRHLLLTRRFLPYFITQFLSAFNDNLFKIALVLFIKFQMTNISDEQSQTLTTLAAGLFILPFFLFSSLAGQLADKFEKARLIRIIRFSEIPTMVLAAIGFYLENVIFLFVILFLMGTKSGFFGPIKYSILPEHLKRDELIGGNGMVEMATFVSILLGTVLGGVLMAGGDGRLYVSFFTITFAILGFAASWYIPKNIPKIPKLKINPNIIGEAFRIMKAACQNKPVFISILGISWFWLVGMTILAQFPNYTKDVVFGGEGVATFFLFTLSAGIGVGSIMCNRVLKSRVSAKLAPWAALGMGVFCIDIYFSSQSAMTGSAQQLLTVQEFLASPRNWRILADFILISLAGGFFTVPLYTILQTRSADKERSRMIAANNIANAFFMVASSLITIALFSLGLSVVDIFLGLGVLTVAIGVMLFLGRGWDRE